jgi:hypothetical protein
MNEESWLCLTAIGAPLVVGAILLFGLQIESNEKAEMAKSGLQQCLVGDQKLWQKQCK